MDQEFEWHPWFAWKPVRSLYTTEWIWLVPVQRRYSSVDGTPMYLEKRFQVSVHDKISL